MWATLEKEKGVTDETRVSTRSRVENDILPEIMKNILYLNKKRWNLNDKKWQNSMKASLEIKILCHHFTIKSKDWLHKSMVTSTVRIIKIKC